MSFYAPHDALELARLFQYHDANCRHDLNQGFITSERDYVSNLATHLRYPTGSIQNSRIPSSVGLSQPTFDGSVASFTLPPVYEQKLGFDGIIILSLPTPDNSEVQYKIGLFEAKWPRMFGGHNHIYPTKTGNPDRWDSMNYSKTPPTPQSASHFSQQLIRQHALAHTDLVLWEQFFSEEPVGSTSNADFKKLGSTCIFHDAAFQYMQHSKVLDPDNYTVKQVTWKRNDLATMLNKGHPHALARIIFGMAICELGRPIIGDLNRVVVPPPPLPVPEGESANTARAIGAFSNGITLNLPTADPSSSAAVHETMRTYGLTNYTHISLSKEGIIRAQREEKLEFLDEIIQSL